MTTVNKDLLDKNLAIEKSMRTLANSYKSMHDARWLFARAHELITHQINGVLKGNPAAFRNPDQMLRFNIFFATAFLAAAAGNKSAPWITAFAECAVGEASYDRMAMPGIPYDLNDHPFQSGHYNTPVHSDNPNAVTLCAISMANAHINTDILAALKTVGCVDKNDYGNILLFVRSGSRQAIIELHGRASGAIYNQLKEWILPLERVWRNSVYTEVCKVPVPDIEAAFEEAVDIAAKNMMVIGPALH